MAGRIIQGSHHQYRWVEQVSSACWSYELFERWPQIVVGRCAVMTMFDCGPIHPDAKEIARGWTGVNGTLVNPRVANARDIPYSGQGDQVFVFDDAPVQSVVGEFMNFDTFTLEFARDHFAAMHPIGDRIAQGRSYEEFLTPFQEQFWNLMQACSARAFIGNGVARFFFVTDDPGVHSNVADWMVAA